MLKESMERKFERHTSLHCPVHDEHRCYKNGVFFIVYIDFRGALLAALLCAFFSFIAHWNIDLGWTRLVFVICVLDLEVKLDKLFRILRSTWNRFRCPLLLSPIRLICWFIRLSRGMEDTRCLFCQTSKSLKGRFSLIFLLFWEDQITVICPFRDERSVNFEIWLD